MPNLFPVQFLLATFAGWTNRYQAKIIDYLIEENHAPIDGAKNSGSGEVIVSEWLGGLLKHYHRPTTPGSDRDHHRASSPR